jgi:hypothetical protein
MEFKIGDKVNMHPDSAYLLQGSYIDIYGHEYFMNGCVIENPNVVADNIVKFSSILKERWIKERWIRVMWENNTSNSYRYKDLVLNVKENRDKLLNEILNFI